MWTRRTAESTASLNSFANSRLPASPGSACSDPVRCDQAVIRALRQQGCVWRRLLTGQQAADQLLDGRAYVGAAASLLANGRRLAFHYAWKWSWAILATAASVG